MQKLSQAIFSVALLLCATVAQAADYKKILAGKRLIMKDTNCAGLIFDENTQNAAMIGEIACMHGDEDGLALRVKWIKPDTFVLVEREQTNEKFPPRNFIYSVHKVRGNTVVFRKYWTGWNEHEDTLQEYTMK